MKILNIHLVKYLTFFFTTLSFYQLIVPVKLSVFLNAKKNYIYWSSKKNWSYCSHGLYLFLTSFYLYMIIYRSLTSRLVFFNVSIVVGARVHLSIWRNGSYEWKVAIALISWSDVLKDPAEKRRTRRQWWLSCSRIIFYFCSHSYYCNA